MQAKILFFAQKQTVQSNFFTHEEIFLPTFCTIILYRTNVVPRKFRIFVQQIISRLWQKYQHTTTVSNLRT